MCNYLCEFSSRGLNGVVKYLQKSFQDDPAEASRRRGAIHDAASRGDVEELDYSSENSDDDEIEGQADESEMVEDEKEIKEATRKRQQQEQQNQGDDDWNDETEVDAELERRLLSGRAFEESDIDRILNGMKTGGGQSDQSGLTKTGKVCGIATLQ